MREIFEYRSRVWWGVEGRESCVGCPSLDCFVRLDCVQVDVVKCFFVVDELRQIDLGWVGGDISNESPPKVSIYVSDLNAQETHCKVEIHDTLGLTLITVLRYPIDENSLSPLGGLKVCSCGTVLISNSFLIS